MKKILLLLIVSTLVVSANAQVGYSEQDMEEVFYACGVVQTKGFDEYLRQNIDMTYKSQFVMGFMEEVSGKNYGERPAAQTAAYKAYDFGHFVGSTIKDVVPNLENELLGRECYGNARTTHLKQLANGFLDGINGKGRFTHSQAQEVFDTKSKSIKGVRMLEEYGANKAAGEQFLERNRQNPGIHVLPSGVQYKVISQGSSNRKPRSTSKVKVHYEGKLIDDTVFGSSYNRDEPAVFGVNQVIPGWSEALQLMTVGSVWEVYIPQELAYGEREAGGSIKPFSTLIFKIQLISIEEF